jgi:hypothetical protein
MVEGNLRSGGVLVITLLISGCVVSSPVVPAGNNTYMVSSRSRACLKCTMASTALQTANQFCASKGKSLVIHNTSGYMNPFGYNAENQLIFSCLDQNDPALQQAVSAGGMIFVDPTHE